MRIIIDAFGGDYSPAQMIKGARLAADEFDATIVLSGDQSQIERVAGEQEIRMDHIEILHASDVISMCDEPTSLLKKFKNSSMAVGLQSVADGHGDAFVSAGSTGALTVGATFIGKRIRGIKRVALAPIVPSAGEPFMLVDSGANADCRPEMLFQFAMMGDVYMKNIHKIEKPRIGLLNVGVEDTKGGTLQKETFARLKASDLNFVGNIEARDAVFGVCDVLVADGFSGNVFLKTTEGTALYIMKSLKEVLMSGLKAKMAALALKEDLNVMKKKFDVTEHGGAVMLGSKIPVIKAHGNATAVTIKNAVKQAIFISETKVIPKISEKIQRGIDNDDKQ